jgi:hypothetical protein
LSPLGSQDTGSTAASLAVSADAIVRSVQRMLGHASAAMTLDLHSRLFDDDLDGVAERLDAAHDKAPVSPACHNATVARSFRVIQPYGQQRKWVAFGI